MVRQRFNCRRHKTGAEKLIRWRRDDGSAVAAIYYPGSAISQYSAHIKIRDTVGCRYLREATLSTNYVNFFPFVWFVLKTFTRVTPSRWWIYLWFVFSGNLNQELPAELLRVGSRWFMCTEGQVQVTDPRPGPCDWTWSGDSVASDQGDYCWRLRSQIDHMAIWWRSAP